MRTSGPDGHSLAHMLRAASRAIHGEVARQRRKNVPIWGGFLNHEHGVRRSILITLMAVACLSIAACQDQGNKQSGGETRRQEQSGKASAGETRGTGPVRTACQAETEKFCPGEEQAGRCLRNRSPDELSETCRAALANRGSR